MAGLRSMGSSWIGPGPRDAWKSRADQALLRAGCVHRSSGGVARRHEARDARLRGMFSHLLSETFMSRRKMRFSLAAIMLAAALVSACGGGSDNGDIRFTRTTGTLDRERGVHRQRQAAVPAKRRVLPRHEHAGREAQPPHAARDQLEPGRHGLSGQHHPGRAGRRPCRPSRLRAAGPGAGVRPRPAIGLLPSRWLRPSAPSSSGPRTGVRPRSSPPCSRPG